MQLALDSGCSRDSSRVQFYPMASDNMDQCVWLENVPLKGYMVEVRGTRSGGRLAAAAWRRRQIRAVTRAKSAGFNKKQALVGSSAGQRKNTCHYDFSSAFPGARPSHYPQHTSPKSWGRTLDPSKREVLGRLPAQYR